MGVIKKPKRINNDLALKADGVDQAASFTTDNRQEFGSNEWAFAIFFYPLSTTAGQRIFQLFDSPAVFNLNITSSLILNMAIRSDQNTDCSQTIDNNNDGYRDGYSCIIGTRLGNDIIVYFNGREAGRTTIPGTDTFNFISQICGIFARQNLTTDFFNGFINNFFFLDKGVTDNEAKQITSKGGYIPSSFHAFVLNHWPLTQRSYYDDAGTLKAWDVVEQYNYAKQYDYGQSVSANKITDSSGVVGISFIANETTGTGDFELQFTTNQGGSDEQISIGIYTGTLTTQNDIDYAFLLDSDANDIFTRELSTLTDTLTNFSDYTDSIPLFKIKRIGGTITGELIDKDGSVLFSVEFDTLNSVNYNICAYKEQTGINEIWNMSLNRKFISKASGAAVFAQNNSKYLSLSPNHVELSGFTSEELGIDNTNDPAGSIYQTISKDQSKYGLTEFNGTTSKVVIPDAANLTFGDGAGNNVTFAISAWFKGLSSSSRIFEKGDETTTTGRQYILTIGATGALQFILFAEGVNILTFDEVIDLEKTYFVVVQFDSTASDIQLGMKGYLFADGELLETKTLGAAPAQQTIVASSETQLIGRGDGNFADGFIGDVRVHDSIFSLSEAFKLYAGKTLGTEISGWALNSFETLQATGTVNDIFGGGNNGTYTDLIEGPLKSGIRPIKNALRFVRTSNHYLRQNTINIDTNADHYTIMVIVKKPDGNKAWGPGFNDLFVYAYDGTANNRFLFGGRETKGIQFSIVDGGVANTHLWITDYAQPDDWQVYFITVDQNLAAAGNSEAERAFINGVKELSQGGGSSAQAKLRFDLYTQIFFGRNIFAAQYYEGFIAAFGIWNRELNLKEMAELSNNLLFEPPINSLKDGLQQYNNFFMQTANGIDDLSGNGNHIDAFFNYTVNELDPGHPDYKFININTLR